MHSFGGATLARRRLAQQRTLQRTYSTEDPVDFPLIPGNVSNTQLSDLRAAPNSALIESGFNYATIDETTKAYLDSFSYEDLYTLKQIPCSMSKKKEIRYVNILII